MKSGTIMFTFLSLAIILGVSAFLLLHPYQKPDATDSSSAHSHESENTGDKTCTGTITSASVLIRAGKFFPDNLTVNRCTYVEIFNYEKGESLPALGEHDDHIHYPGFVETVLAPGKYYVFQATKPGTYLLHDHLHDATKGVITINP